VRLSAADGRNISIVVDNLGGAATAANLGLAGIVTADVGSSTYEQEAETYYATVTLHSAKAIEVSAGINGKTALENLNFRAGTYGGAQTGQFLKDLDISTVAGANKALEAVSNALETINSQRGELGAVQNRLESTIANLEVNRDNLVASKSRIMDADFAEETTQLAKAQILQQAGIAMLAQAKQAPQNVLSLLR
jgi:flagellin